MYKYSTVDVGIFQFQSRLQFVFRRVFLFCSIRQYRLLNPPIFHLQTLWYIMERMKRAWKKIEKKRVEWIKLVKARTFMHLHIHTHIHTHNKPNKQQQKATLTHLLPQRNQILSRFVCHSQGIYSISSMWFCVYVSRCFVSISWNWMLQMLHLWNDFFYYSGVNLQHPCTFSIYTKTQE